MKSEGSDFCKVALVFGMVAFQLHILTMTTSNFLIFDATTLSVDRSNHRNNVIQAFIIIAYLLYVASVILLLALSYSNGVRGSKALSVVTAFVLFIAASSVIIGLAVFDAETYYKQKPGQFSRPFSSYLTTTYVTAAASGYASCIVLLVSLCM